MKIRLMKKTDFDGLYVMWKKSKLKLDSYQNEKKEFNDMLTVNPESCFVALNKNQIIGSVFGTNNGRRSFIYHLAVHPDWQRKGIGKKLLQKAEYFLKKTGVSRVRLMVNLDNLRVVPFYEKCGYDAYDTYCIFMGKNL